MVPTNLNNFNNLNIRKVRVKDSEFLFMLRNEESVRAVSLNSAPITWEAHQRWFEKKLANPNSMIYISESDSSPIAQTRYDVNGESAEVSISVVIEFRGKGYGSEILKRTAEKFFRNFPFVKTVKAYINMGNVISLRSFAKAGYQLIGNSEEGGLTRNLMILNR